MDQRGAVRKFYRSNFQFRTNTLCQPPPPAPPEPSLSPVRPPCDRRFHKPPYSIQPPENRTERNRTGAGNISAGCHLIVLHCIAVQYSWKEISTRHPSTNRHTSQHRTIKTEDASLSDNDQRSIRRHYPHLSSIIPSPRIHNRIASQPVITKHTQTQVVTDRQNRRNYRYIVPDDYTYIS